jgi:type II secretory pathway component GspD/PulD (secretin)
MSGDSAVMQHCATCPDCSRLTTVLRDREYNAANVLNNLPPMSNPITLAETAVITAHRRRVGRVVVMISGAALVVTIWFTAATLILPAMGSNGPTASTLLTETIPLSCLSPQQAADIIDPYLRTRGSLYFIPTSGISAITVRGTAAQLSKSKDLIRNFESDRAAACRTTPTGSNKVPTASAERPEPKEQPEPKERPEPKKH